MLSEIARMVFPLSCTASAMQNREQYGMNTQRCPRHSFCKSAPLNAMLYPGHGLGGGGSPSFSVGFSAGQSYPKLLKICYTFHNKRQLHFGSEVILTAEPPFSPGFFIYEVLRVLWDDYKVFIVEEMDDFVLTV